MATLLEQATGKALKARGKVERYETSSGIRIYKLPVLAFPMHITNCYLVLDGEVTLIDTGSGLKPSNESLVAAFDELKTEFNETAKLSDVRRVLATHGHIDHFGGLNFVVEQSGAKIGIHELDMSTVRDFQERLIVSSRNLDVFLGRAGLSEKEVTHFVESNKWSKNVFQATPVDFTFVEGDVIGDLFKVYHAPGHCPGQVCLGLDDILFTADHVLSRITPNQSPESIIRYNGLGHYYESLRKVRSLEGFRLGLGGHEETIHDLYGRIDEIISFHDRRLNRTLEICATPKSIQAIAREMFPNATDYHALLALTEAGAHVEYLYERGKLQVTNIEEVERERNPVLLYCVV